MILLAGLARSMAMHAYSAIPDIEADTQSGIQTVATLYGKQGTLIFCTVCYSLAMVLSLPAMGWGSLVLGAVYLVLMALSFRSDVFRLYKYFPWINTIVGCLLFFYLISLKIGWF
jgi:4-hydroxybenzoate polyprenyltransferase